MVVFHLGAKILSQIYFARQLWNHEEERQSQGKQNEHILTWNMEFAWGCTRKISSWYVRSVTWEKLREKNWPTSCLWFVRLAVYMPFRTKLRNSWRQWFPATSDLNATIMREWSVLDVNNAWMKKMRVWDERESRKSWNQAIVGCVGKWSTQRYISLAGQVQRSAIATYKRLAHDDRRGELSEHPIEILTKVQSLLLSFFS